MAWRPQLPVNWVEEVGEYATLVWRGSDEQCPEEEMEAHEYAWVGGKY
jgi:hypothetical protein